MPDILLHRLPHIIAAIAYGLLGLYFLRTRWAEKNNSNVAAPMNIWERWSIFAVFSIQAAGLYEEIFGYPAMRFSFSLALSLMMWLAVFIYWAESFRSRMDGLQPMVLPLAAVCTVLPAIFPAAHDIGHTGTLGFKLHFLTAMLAYSMFTLSALHAIFMGFTERKLHQRALTRSLASLPPLLAMEALLFRMIVIAFILLSLALGSGAFYSEAIFGKPFRFEHKTIFAFISWGIFAWLLAGRHLYGWRGKTALRFTLSGFVILILAYIGSRFVIEVLLNRN